MAWDLQLPFLSWTFDSRLHLFILLVCLFRSVSSRRFLPFPNDESQIFRLYASTVKGTSFLIYLLRLQRFCVYLIYISLFQTQNLGYCSYIISLYHFQFVVLVLCSCFCPLLFFLPFTVLIEHFM